MKKEPKNDLRYIKTEKTNSKTFLRYDSGNGLYSNYNQRTNRTSKKINRKHFICIILHWIACC